MKGQEGFLTILFILLFLSLGMLLGQTLEQQRVSKLNLEAEHKVAFCLQNPSESLILDDRTYPCSRFIALDSYQRAELLRD